MSLLQLTIIYKTTYGKVKSIHRFMLYSKLLTTYQIYELRVIVQKQKYIGDSIISLSPKNIKISRT